MRPLQRQRLLGGRVLGEAALGDVRDRGVDADKPAALVELGDPGLAEPAHRAVGRAHDPVLDSERVDGPEKRRVVSDRTVVRVDEPRDPYRVRLVLPEDAARVRRPDALLLRLVPDPVADGAELLAALEERAVLAHLGLGLLGLRQVEDDADVAVARTVDRRGGDPHRHFRAVGAPVELLHREALDRPARQLGHRRSGNVLAARDVEGRRGLSDHLGSRPAEDRKIGVVALEDPPVAVDDRQADGGGLEQRPVDAFHRCSRHRPRGAPA